MVPIIQGSTTAVVESPLAMDIFALRDVFQSVLFVKLAPPDLSRLSQTNRYLRDLVDCETTWRLVFKHQRVDELIEAHPLFANRYRKQPLPWRSVFVDLFLLRTILPGIPDVDPQASTELRSVVKWRPLIECAPEELRPFNRKNISRAEAAGPLELIDYSYSDETEHHGVFRLKNGTIALEITGSCTGSRTWTFPNERAFRAHCRRCNILHEMNAHPPDYGDVIYDLLERANSSDEQVIRALRLKYTLRFSCKWNGQVEQFKVRGIVPEPLLKQINERFAPKQKLMLEWVKLSWYNNVKAGDVIDLVTIHDEWLVAHDLAEKGDRLKQVQVASNYQVQCKWDLARFWYLKAAEQGDTNSAYHAGILLFSYPDDLPQDFLAAEKWLQIAVSKNHVMATKVLVRLRSLPEYQLAKEKATTPSP